MYANVRKGRYIVVNPEKYKGDAKNVVYRSGLEYRMMRYLDLHTDVLEWSSEEVVIPYLSPIDGKLHRYFVDMYALVRRKDGSSEKLLIEVKPDAQTRAPRKKKVLTESYINAAATWAVNQAKWKAASAFCKSKGWTFKIITEKDLAPK